MVPELVEGSELFRKERGGREGTPNGALPRDLLGKRVRVAGRQFADVAFADVGGHPAADRDLGFQPRDETLVGGRILSLSDDRQHPVGQKRATQ